MGSLQVNGFDVSDYPFRNLFKDFGSLQSGSGYAFPSIMTAAGYPEGTPSINIFGTINPFPTEYTGNYVLKWTGAISVGTGLQLATGTTVSSGGGFVNGSTAINTNVRGTNGRVVFTFNSVPSNLTVSFLSGTTFTGLSNLVLVREDWEAGLDGGDMFSPDFMAKYQTLAPSIIRTMPWLDPNDSNNVTNDLYLGDASNFHYGAQWHPSLWAGSLAGTNTYTCSAAADTPGSWTDGEIIQAQIINANTSTTVTLDVGSRGAKTVWTAFATVPDVGFMNANRVATFIYVAKIDKVLYFPSALKANKPLSVCVAAANALNADLWINIPHLMIDAAVTRWAQYVKANLNSGLTAYFELSNEVWNFGGGFPQTSLYHVIGRDFYGFPDNNNRTFYSLYAKRSREIFGLATTVWAGATQPRLQRVLAFQAFGPSSSTNTYRLQGADLTLDASGNYTTVPANIVTNYSTVGNRPIDFCDALSYATYWAGHHTFQFDPEFTALNFTELRSAADDYNSGTPALMESALDWLDADIRGTTATSQTLKDLRDDIYPTWNTIAASYGVEVVGYEGGCGIVSPSVSRLTALSIDTAYSAKITALITAYKRNWRFKVTSSAQMRQFTSVATSRTPSWFVGMGANPWSLHEGDLYSDPWQSWYAMVARTSGKEVFSITSV